VATDTAGNTATSTIEVDDTDLCLVTRQLLLPELPPRSSGRSLVGVWSKRDIFKE
jgi:hypothetical protein